MRESESATRTTLARVRMNESAAGMKLVRPPMNENAARCKDSRASASEGRVRSKQEAAWASEDRARSSREATSPSDGRATATRSDASLGKSRPPDNEGYGAATTSPAAKMLRFVRPPFDAAPLHYWTCCHDAARPRPTISDADAPLACNGACAPGAERKPEYELISPHSCHCKLSPG